MYTVTFYSYKEGVGRTMALMNVAFRLSAQRKKVFIIDFDLEAPGIDVFCGPSADPHEGLVEYLHWYSASGMVDDITKYVLRIGAQDPEGYPLHIMPAGRKDDEYQVRLAQLNWKEFYLAQRGFLFVENLKAAIKKTFSPDYLLIDSRTGLTDISGICTLQLPDLVVMLFGLNRQNIQGISRIYKSIAHNRLDREIKTLLIASPVPELAAYSEVKAERFMAAQQQIGSAVDSSIPFDASIAFEESFVVKQQSGPLAQAYDNLSTEIIATNGFDFLNMSKTALALQRGGESEDAKAKFQEMLTTFPDNPDVWELYAQFLLSTSLTQEAVQAFHKALTLGGRKRIYGHLATAYLGLENRQAALDAFANYIDHAHSAGELFGVAEMFALRGEVDTAVRAYEGALALVKPDDRQAYLSMAELGNLFLSRRDAEKALPYVKRALELEPNSMASCFNYAFALELIGRYDEAGELYRKTSKIFEKTDLSIIPPTSRANTLQAIAHCYRFLNQKDVAVQCLRRASKIADTVPNGRIFSVVQYRFIPSNEFKLETEALLRDLEPGSEGNTSVN
jgi:tetratricopeptide (TPR) repeat protein